MYLFRCRHMNASPTINVHEAKAGWSDGPLLMAISFHQKFICVDIVRLHATSLLKFSLASPL